MHYGPQQLILSSQLVNGLDINHTDYVLRLTMHQEALCVFVLELIKYQDISVIHCPYNTDSRSKTSRLRTREILKCAFLISIQIQLSVRCRHTDRSASIHVIAVQRSSVILVQQLNKPC